MTTEIRTTGDGQTSSSHTCTNKRQRQDDMSGVETSTKRRRTSAIYYMLKEKEKKQQRNKDLADNWLQKRNEHEVDQESGGTNNTIMEDNNDKNRFDDVIQHQSRQSNSDFGISITKVEPCDDDVPTVFSADSALDLSRRNEALVSLAFHEDYDADKEQSKRPPIIDYATALHDHKYYAFGSLFEAADMLECITNVHLVDQRSELEREICMFCRDWLTQYQDPSIKYLDIYLDTNCDRDMEKVYESDVYIEVQNLVKKFNKKTASVLKHFIDMMPMTKEVLNYEINWQVVDKYALHEKMRPWISNIAKNPTDEEAYDVVCDILGSMKHHCSALSIHETIMSFRLVSDESEKLFRNI